MPGYRLEDPEERARLAAEYGFRKIGEPVPASVTLKQITDSIPAEAFEIDDLKAWKTVAITVGSVSLGLAMIAVSPWFLLPLAWAWTGTAATGLFVIGHDCAHKAFSRNKLVEDIVGTIAFMPLIYPYEPWRFKHDRHHAKTNQLIADTAWHPVMKNEYKSAPSSVKTGLQLGMGPLRFVASIGHWLVYHFDLKKFRPSEKPRVKISLAAVYGFMAVCFPLLIASTGLDGWFKFWLLPGLGVHFWMSTFPLVHHTAPHIPFKKASDWNAAQAQLGGTVHCDYPKWVEVLCHDINVHVPHHVSQKIPSYNLRLATDSLRQNWGKYMNEATWNWRLMKTIFTDCHIYDPEENYVPFDRAEDSPIISTLRKFMPPLAAK
jgi:omega-6 fatty acid desaturase (delta-12 desaturase)